MKILFVGTLISPEAMEYFNKTGKRKASVAPNNYETMLVKGLVENGVQVDVLSFPAVAAFPGNKKLFFGTKKENLKIGVTSEWVPFINVQFFKQLTLKYSFMRKIKRWLKENKDTRDKLVMSYSVYPSYTKPIIKLCKKYGCHTNAVITDLPEYMYSWEHNNPILKLLGKKMSQKMLDLQDKLDSYILFTEKMANRMSVESKPYIVSEGFSDSGIYDGVPDIEKSVKKTAVYAGNLSILYGMQSLLEGFMKTAGDYQLHLYGSGMDDKYIRDCAEKDERIKYMGRVSRQEVLKALKSAHLLVINKPTSDDYSNYSFSSKILEYMTSGTPVLTTRVGGMPTEYYDYFYFIDDETPEGIAKSLEEALSKSENELWEFGERAKNFAVEEKNYKKQCEKIVEFLKKFCKN